MTRRLDDESVVGMPAPPVHRPYHSRDDCKDELCREIRESKEETRRLMRALHEEVMDHLEKLGEALTRRRDGLRPQA